MAHQTSSYLNLKAEYEEKVERNQNTVHDDVAFRKAKNEYHRDLNMRRDKDMVNEEE